MNIKTKLLLTLTGLTVSTVLIAIVVLQVVATDRSEQALIESSDQQMISVRETMKNQIAAAAEEQSAVSEEINKSIVNITEISKETANGTEQTTIASNDQARLASELKTMVNQFKVGSS